MKRFQRAVSCLLTACLMFSLLPAAAWAGEIPESSLPAETAAAETAAATVQTEAETIPVTLPAETEQTLPSVPETVPGLLPQETLPAAQSQAATATGTCGDGLTWQYDSGLLRIDGEGSMTDWTYAGADTAQPWADYREQVTLVEIGTGVTAIGSSAFTGFSSLTSVSIPGTVERIGSYAFEGCVSLQSVRIPGSVYAVSDHAFAMCASLTEVTLEEGVSVLGDMAFQAAGMVQFRFPASITVIGSQVFSACASLTALTFDGNAPEIAADAFDGVEAAVSYDPGSEGWDTAAGQNYGGSLTWESGEDPVVPETGFAYSYLGDGTLTITGSGAMPNYGYGEAPWASLSQVVTKVVVADSVTTIGDYAFCEFDTLTEAVIGANVALLGQRAFGACSALGKVTFTGSAPVIDISAFGAVDTVVWYPAGDDSWTDDVRKNYGGSLTWLCRQEDVSEGSGGDGITWTLDAGGTLHISGSGTLVQTDGMSAVSKNVSAVVLEEGITAIGDYAFDGFSAMTRIRLPDTLTEIGDYAFLGCSGLTYVTIPAGLTGLGTYAFSKCTALASIVFQGNAPTIGSYAFNGCTLTAWYPENDDTWNGALNIYGALKIHWACGSPYSEDFYVDQGSFGSNMSWRLTDTGRLIISGFGPMSTQYSWPWKDQLGDIKAVEIKHGVTSVGGFEDCVNLTEVTFADTVTEISGSAFQDCDSLTELMIPDTVDTVGNMAFYGCDLLQSVTIPGSVSVIGESAFGYCPCLRELNLEEGVTTLEKYAFSHCTALTEVTLPDSLVTINRSAFSGCGNLETVRFGANLETIAQQAFENCVLLREILLPEGLKTISPNAFAGCEGLAAVHIPASVEFVRASSFYRCSNLVNLTVAEDSPYFKAEGNVLFSADGSTLYLYPVALEGSVYSVPDGVTCISDYAFREALLETVTLPEGLTAVSSGAFEDCVRLRSIVFPDSLVAVGSSAFSGCTGLSQALIPNVTILGTSAFSGCTALEAVTLSDSLTEIGASAFYQCKALETIRIPGSVMTIGSKAFQDCESLLYIDLPDTVSIVGSDAFAGCKMLSSAALGSGLTTIGDRAFEMCIHNLSSIVIPGTVTSIGKEAFSGAYGLSRVYFMGAAPTFGANVFRNLYDPLTLYYPAGDDSWTEAVRQSYGAKGSVTWVAYDPASGPMAADMAELEARMAAALEAGSSRFEVDFPVTLTHDLTIPGGLSLWITAGGSLVIPEGVTLTLGRDLQAYEKVEIHSGGTLVIPETTTANGRSYTPVFYGDRIVLQDGGCIDAPDGRVHISFDEFSYVSGVPHRLISGSYDFETLSDLRAILESSGTLHAVTLTFRGTSLTLTESLTLPANSTLDPGSSGTLKIPGGVTLTADGQVSGSEALHIAGTLVVNGSLTSNRSGLTMCSGGCLEINGSASFRAPQTFVSGSTLINRGRVSQYAATTFDSGSTLINGGTISLYDQVLHLRKGAKVTNTGRILEQGGTLLDEASPVPEQVRLYWDSEVTGKTISLDINSNQTIHLTAGVLPREASQKVTWSSSNEKVATVNTASGQVTFHTAGTVKITATTPNKKSASVTFLAIAVPHDVGKTTPPVPEGEADLQLLSGKSLTLSALDNETGKTLTSKQITWTLDEQFAPFAKIDAKGKLTAKKVVQRTRIEAVGTMVGNSAIRVVYAVDLCPAVTHTVVTLDGSTVNNETLYVDQAGGPLSLAAEIYPLDAMEGISWTISDKKEAFASYEIEGNVLTVTPKTGVKAGTVTVKATSTDGSKKTATVKLQFGTYATKVTIDKSITELTAGDKAVQLTASMEPEVVTKAGIVWSLKNSTDKSYVNLTTAGKITPKNVLAPVDVTVVATSKDGLASDEHTIRISPASQGQLVIKSGDVFVTKTTRTLDVNKQESITLSAHTYGESELTPVTWSPLSSKAAEITVNADGTLTIRMIAAGSITVNAVTEDGRKASVTIKGAKLASSLEISQKKTNISADDVLELASGKSLDLQAVLTDAASKKVTWTIAEGEAFATVSNGKVTAKKDLTSGGRVVVRATAADGSGVEDTIAITVRPIAQGVQVYSEAGGQMLFSVRTENWWVRSNTTLVWDPELQGDTIALKARVFPDYGGEDVRTAIQDVTWKSSSPKVADILRDENGQPVLDETGSIRLVIFKAGTVTITVTANDGSKQKVTFKLKVI